MRPAVDGVLEKAGAETSLESFVAQLHREGVAAGQREAERLIREAREEAAELVRRAGAEAEALLQDARVRAAREQERSRAELALSARDTVLHLQSAIDGVLKQLLERSVRGVLEDPEFLRRLVADVVGAYARADAVGRPTAVRLPQAMERQLEACTAELLAAGLRQDAEVAATLREAGFEYRLTSGGVVEVSAAAVVERLLDLLPPRLREIVGAAAQAAAGSAEAEPRGRPPLVTG